MILNCTPVCNRTLQVKAQAIVSLLLHLYIIFKMRIWRNLLSSNWGNWHMIFNQWKLPEIHIDKLKNILQHSSWTRIWHVHIWEMKTWCFLADKQNTSNYSVHLCLFSTLPAVKACVLAAFCHIPQARCLPLPHIPSYRKLCYVYRQNLFFPNSLLPSLFWTDSLPVDFE